MDSLTCRRAPRCRGRGCACAGDCSAPPPRPRPRPRPQSPRARRQRGSGDPAAWQTPPAGKISVHRQKIFVSPHLLLPRLAGLGPGHALPVLHLEAVVDVALAACTDQEVRSWRLCLLDIGLAFANSYFQMECIEKLYTVNGEHS